MNTNDAFESVKNKVMMFSAMQNLTNILLILNLFNIYLSVIRSQEKMEITDKNPS